MRPTEKIKRFVKGKRSHVETDAALDERVMTDSYAAMDEAMRSAAGQVTPNIWRIIMKSKITKFAVAAVVIIAVGLSITLLDKTVPTAYALEQTAEALKNAHNVHSIFMDRQGRRVNAWGKIDHTTGMITVMRMEYEDGGLYIITKDQTYFEDDGLVAVKEGQYIKCGLVFNDFISKAARRLHDLGRMEVEKKISEEFHREVIVVNVKQPNVHLQAIIDIDTKLPIKFSIPWVAYPNEPLDYTELLEYELDLPPDFFEFKLGPDTMVLGKHLDTQFAKDPAYGITYNDDEDLQHLCHRIAGQYIQAKIDKDIETIKQLHSIHINRYGSNKMIEQAVNMENYNNGKIIELLEFKPAYENKPRQMMVPCKVIKDYKGQPQEMYSGVIVYLREHDGQKSAVITGFYPRLSEKQINNTQ